MAMADPTTTFVKKTPEELAKMTAAERMSYDHQLKLYQNGAQGTTTSGENIDWAQKISDDAQAGKPGIGKPSDIVTPPTAATKTPEEQLSEAYKEPLKNLGDYIKDFEDRKTTLKEQDEVAKRRSRSMRMIAGISDGLSALANLVGVAGVNGKHASNQQLSGASTPLAQRLEAARLERKADIKDISDRLDAYKAQRDALNLQKGTALAEIQLKREQADRELAAANAKSQMDWLKFMMGEANEDNRLAARLAHEASEGAANRTNATTNAVIRNQGEKNKNAWEFKVDGQTYSFDTDDETVVAEVFNLLPQEVRDTYGSLVGDQLLGERRQNPDKEQMKIAIGEHLNDPEFMTAFKARYGNRKVSSPAGGGKTAQSALDEI